jgi:hypothetical protein
VMRDTCRLQVHKTVSFPTLISSRNRPVHTSLKRPSTQPGGFLTVDKHHGVCTVKALQEKVHD